MRTKKEIKELEKRLSEIFEVVRNRFKLDSDVDITWSYETKVDFTEVCYRKVIPSGEEFVTIRMKKVK